MEQKNRRPRLFEGHDFDRKTMALVLLLLFVVGAVSGWLYEMGFYRIDLGQFVKRGHGIGPWLPIYGFGSVLILLTTFRLRKHPLAVLCWNLAPAGCCITFGAGCACGITIRRSGTGAILEAMSVSARCCFSLWRGCCWCMSFFPFYAIWQSGCPGGQWRSSPLSPSVCSWQTLPRATC